MKALLMVLLGVVLSFGTGCVCCPKPTPGCPVDDLRQREEALRRGRPLEELNDTELILYSMLVSSESTVLAACVATAEGR